MVDLFPVFSEKSELQHIRISTFLAFFGNPLICGSQYDMFQKKYFESNNEISDHGKLG